MSTVAVRPLLFAAPGGEPTLEQELGRVWQVLSACAVARCPVCGDKMGPECGADARPIGGRCTACGATLA